MKIARRNHSTEKHILSKVYLQKYQNSEIEFRGLAKIDEVKKAYSGSDYIVIVKVVDYNIHTGFEREVYIYPSVLTIN